MWNLLARARILSFDWRVLVHVQKIAPEIPTVYLAMIDRSLNNIKPGASPWMAGLDIDDISGSIPQAVKTAGGRYWAPYYEHITFDRLNEAHDLGLKVYVWTPDKRNAMIRLLTHWFSPLILNNLQQLNKLNLLRCTNMQKLFLIVLLVILISLNGCTAPKIRLFPSQADPLKERILDGKADQKILVIPVRGIISDTPKEGIIRTRPSIVQEVVSQLKLAEEDKNVKAVILKIDSPGGTVTASDILYNEILDFKNRTGATLVAAMMGVAASGAYQISLPADYILAHPTTVTGSIGAIMVRPRVTGLMQKIGVGVEVNKSGKNKDIGSPFRTASPEEEQILQDLTDRLGVMFVNLVVKHRKLEPEAIAEISTARVYLASEALGLGLVDEIGYLEKAILKAKKLAKLPEDSKVVVYRRTEYPDDNIYNTSTRYGGDNISIISLELPGSLNQIKTGFYYLWPAVTVSD